MSERCFVCGEDNPNVLHRHHLVPRRYNGNDDDKNIYTLCANCHEAVEKMYNDDFYEELGMAEEQKEHPTPQTIPSRFVDENIKHSPDGWTEKEKVREVYSIFCKMRDIRILPSAVFGRAMHSLDGYSVKAGQRKDPNGGGRLQVYNGIELTAEAKALLDNRAERQSRF